MRACDLIDIAGSTRYLAELSDSGVIERLGRGLYGLPESLENTHYENFARVAALRPDAVICLLSALQFHDIGTQMPPATWVAIPTGSWAPIFSDVPVEYVRMQPQGLYYGVETHQLGQVKVRISSPVKTVCDAFRFRRKIGTSVAIEALRDALNSNRFSSDDLYICATETHIWSVIRPYAETIG